MHYYYSYDCKAGTITSHVCHGYSIIWQICIAVTHSMSRLLLIVQYYYRTYPMHAWDTQSGTVDDETAKQFQICSE